MKIVGATIDYWKLGLSRLAVEAVRGELVSGWGLRAIETYVSGQSVLIIDYGLLPLK